MALATGAQLGHYKIQSMIGSGGMGEVYRALDTKLEREVAVKVLPAALASDPERLARFEREAKVLAQLNHPRIASIYGVEERALVMELVPGPTLADRISQGPIPSAEAEHILLELAEALEYAHDRGVVHRDLKPANIKIDPEDKVKVLDFGLAKAFAEPGADPVADPANSPTVTMGGTMAGTILGTAAYMAPEQARGKKVDKRADIWAYGVIAWEIFSGQRLFQGEDTVQVLGKVLEQPVDVERVPARFRKVIGRCLDRNPKDRLRDIGDVRFSLTEPEVVAPAVASVETASSRRSLTAWSVAGVLAIGLGVVGWIHFREAVPEKPFLQYTITPPEKTVLVNMALSPDGRMLAMETTGAATSQLWIRNLDSLQSRPLPGTEGGQLPFWSPDSRNLGFFTQDSLKRLSVAGGGVQTLCRVANARGGTWSAEDVILFAPSPSQLQRVPAGGGTCASVSVPADQQQTYARPQFLPNGKQFLYQAGGLEPGVYLGFLDGTKPREVLADSTPVTFVQPEATTDLAYLMFLRDGRLKPVRASTLESAGDVVPLVENVDRAEDRSIFSASRNGILAYATSGGTYGERFRQLTWRDRSGKKLGTVGAPGVVDFLLSPDAKRVALERPNAQGSDIWIADLEHNSETRLTFGGDRTYTPVWSPDGVRLAFAQQAKRSIFLKRADGSDAGQVLFDRKTNVSEKDVGATVIFDWTRDGKYALVNSGGHTFAVPQMGDGKPVELDVAANRLQVSPDERWIAYTSGTSGRLEVYVQPFAPAYEKKPAGKWQISAAGGSSPRWRGDSRELYYQAADSKIMAVGLRSSATSFEFDVPKPLFQPNVETRGVLGGGGFRYSVTGDGQRFLIQEIPEAQIAEQSQITIVLNWERLLKK